MDLVLYYMIAYNLTEAEAEEAVKQDWRYWNEEN